MTGNPQAARRRKDESCPVVATAEELAAAAARLAGEMDADYPDGLLLVGVLRGAVVFLADLVRALQVPCTVDFIAISHYAPGSGRVRIVKDLEGDISGQRVVIVEDIVDTGLTLSYLLRQLGAREPASLAVCALLDRARRRIVPLEPDYRGFEIDDEFVLGYGLDFAQRYRNLPFLVAGDLLRLRDDPNTHVPELYGRPETDHPEGDRTDGRVAEPGVGGVR